MSRRISKPREGFICKIPKNVSVEVLFLDENGNSITGSSTTDFNDDNNYDGQDDIMNPAEHHSAPVSNSDSNPTMTNSNSNDGELTSATSNRQ
jgi:hypothetical protein